MTSIIENGENSSKVSVNEAKQRAILVEWLNDMVPNLRLPLEASDEELRACLIDGSVFCTILSKLCPECEHEDTSSEKQSRSVKRFLTAMGEMGLPKFEISDLEQGSMMKVLQCLWALRAQYDPSSGEDTSFTNYNAKTGNEQKKRWKFAEIEPLETSSGCLGEFSPRGGNLGVFSPQGLGEFSPRGGNVVASGVERRKSSSESKLQRVLRNPVMSEPSTALLHHVGHKFHEVFQLKQGRYADIPAAKISEMMKSSSLDNAPTQSLLSVVNGILDESIERKNGEIPHRVACLLRKVVQEIERRISTQAEHIRTQNNMFKVREEKYQSRIRVLETLATGATDETQMIVNKLQQIKTEKSKVEERKQLEEQDLIKMKEKEQDVARMLKEEEDAVKRLKEQEHDVVRKLKEKEQDVAKMLKEKEQDVIRMLKEKDHDDQEIAALKQELELTKKRMKEKDHGDQEISAHKQELELTKKMLKERDHGNQEISALKQEIELTKKTYEQHCQQVETQAKEAQAELEIRLKELDDLLTASKNKEKEIKRFSESKAQNWKEKELVYQNFVDFQFKSLQGLRIASETIKNQVVTTHNSYSDEFSHLGGKLRGLTDAVKNYHSVLQENRRLYNEVQDLRGNIRVYCRIRPFLNGQSKKQTSIDYIGENGEVAVINPKQPKESNKLFKFNKVFGPSSTQAEVFLDTQPLIRSVLDGYNVCIFAYGQTGSGKTYTMCGPRVFSKEEWGVNYRALNDLFEISQKRKSAFTYEVGAQMVEIYNEQVRDLLSSDGSQKKLGILTSSQPNGLAVPDATMHPVRSTEDVLELMKIGETNRSVSATAMNEGSSRSHSVLTVHIRGTELESGSALRGSLHLVDLAGSERVDRSEVTGSRLKEAQHINKSLSALGDVIFALAQKSPHVPYRNSKLTQVLQTSLGGQAKTLMFVQLNPDADSYTETLSTLKFAERVSGVELGAARSNKEGKDVRDLMDQVASLKDTLAKKDEEIERLQLLKDPRNEKRSTSSLRQGSSSPSKSSVGGTSQRGRRLSGGKGSGLPDRAGSDQDNCSEYSDKQSEGSQQSLEDFRHHKEFFRQSKLAVVDPSQSTNGDDEPLGFGDVEDEERLSDISDGGLSMGTETDGSMSSVVEFTLFPEGSKQPESPEKPKTPTKIPRPPLKQGQATMARSSSSPKDLSKLSTSSSSKDLSRLSSSSSSSSLRKTASISKTTGSSSPVRSLSSTSKTTTGGLSSASKTTRSSLSSSKSIKR